MCNAQLSYSSKNIWGKGCFIHGSTHSYSCCQYNLS